MHSLSFLDSTHKPKSPVPIPFQLGRYIDDPMFQHEDFNGSSVGTLRARVRKELNHLLVRKELIH